MKKYNIAIVGATGLVGSTFLKVMAEYKIEVNNLYLYASERSEGKIINYLGKDYKVIDLKKARFDNVDFALFSAGGAISNEYAPKFSACGAYVIDNSSNFRMVDGIPLIVPEINIYDYKMNKIIANPNCSTIQSVLPLYYLDKEFGLKKVNYTTLQAVSGSGMKGLNDLKRCSQGMAPEFYPYNISKTCIPEIDVFLDNHYTKEEMKMVNETRKILHKNDIKISATCIRVPVPYSHGVSIVAEFEKDINYQKAIETLTDKPGIVVVDDIKNHGYPVSTMATGNDLVYCGRFRDDLSSDNSIIFYTVGDNVRKGAASNAVMIMIKIMEDLEC
ncbi:aspartate-semialdehyde dehydrogenase [bacterium]|nr:aspartate-semialdehyde dehydrogenase [bacterium]